MNTEELREQIAKFTMRSRGLNWDISGVAMKEAYFKFADQILSLLHQSGWKSPEEIEQWLEERGAVTVVGHMVNQDGFRVPCFEPLRMEMKE